MNAHPIPSHNGLEPGQTWRSNLGTLYRIFAITSDGYVWCTTRVNGRDMSKRLWCDLFINMTIVL